MTISIYVLCLNDDIATAFYVGQTKDLSRRLEDHKYAISRGKHYYSKLNEMLEIVEQITIQQLENTEDHITAFDLEFKWWQYFKNNGFDIVNKNPMKTWKYFTSQYGKMSDEQKKKISATLKETLGTQEAKTLKSAASKASFTRPEVRAKHKAGIIRSYLNPETRAKRKISISIALSNPETRQKLSEHMQREWERRKAKEDYDTEAERMKRSNASKQGQLNRKAAENYNSEEKIQERSTAVSKGWQTRKSREDFDSEEQKERRVQQKKKMWETRHNDPLYNSPEEVEKRRLASVKRWENRRKKKSQQEQQSE